MLLRDKYGRMAKTAIQTRGDLLDERVLEELLTRDVWMVSVSSIDAFHHAEGGDRGERLRNRLTKLFEKAAMKPSAGPAESRESADGAGAVYEFVGATPDAWIAKLWPSGRAWQDRLSTATYADNLCNQWSGGLGFLSLGSAGCEVAIELEVALRVGRCKWAKRAVLFQPPTLLLTYAWPPRRACG